MAFSISAPDLDTCVQVGMDSVKLQTVEGTLQRLNYQRRELTVVAQGQLWVFALDPDCQLWFDDQRAILRCFHPLDQVRVVYEEAGSQRLAKGLYAWEKKMTA